MSPTILITGANGQLGRLVIKELLKSIPAELIAALVRRPETAADLRDLGILIRQGDYTDPPSLKAALKGIEKLLLISSSEVGQRAQQHRNVIDAAKAAGVSLVAYTSLLRADSSPLALAREHAETEAYLKVSGIPHVLLRNGWYSENTIGNASMALANGGYIGAIGNGRISGAPRADYAAAAATVLTSDQMQAGKVYELAGDTSFSLPELAAETARLSGKQVSYSNLPQDAYAAALSQIGLPEAFAGILADSDVGASSGALEENGKALSALIGRPTTPWQETLSATLSA
ncbi:SDR family oxidoreductase [Thalassovita sp.]|uniref:SDR family oxidoreductase n=1 Tax=Thalassovita sp. TaxID=1979401 RepID=UPI0029DE734D|nr:SDR family oxidoreductase [Thalassovita sp.]